MVYIVVLKIIYGEEQVSKLKKEERELEKSLEKGKWKGASKKEVAGDVKAAKSFIETNKNLKVAEKRERE